LIKIGMLKSLVHYLIKVRGCTVKDEVRLHIALVNYLLRNLTKRSSEGSLGFYVPGRSLLAVRTWDNCKFLVRPKTPDLTVATFSMEEYELKRWFLPYARGIVVDVGANIGGYTVRACRQAKLVVAIEPEEETFITLKKNVELNCHKHNAILVRKAIGKEKGTAILKVPRKGELIDTSVASLFKPDIDWRDYVYEEVEVDTLDNIMASLGINRVDFLKVDIEGAEAVAFRGMKRTLENTRYLMIEIRRENEWLIDELKRMGFKLIDRKGINYFFVKTGS